MQYTQLNHCHTLPLTDPVPTVEFARVGRVLPLRVVSWSMYPAIRKGDLLELGSPEAMQVGDIVVFRHSGALVCHRVVRLDPESVVHTQGDYSKGKGEQIRGTDILGKVILIRRGGRRLSPPDPCGSSCAVPIRMRVDQWIERTRERGLSLATHCLTAMTRNTWLGEFAWSTLSRTVAFSVAYPAPIRAVRAYHIVEMGRHPIGNSSLQALPLACRDEQDLIVFARLGRFHLGSLSLASGKVHVRRPASSLPVEEQLRAIGRRVQEWKKEG